MEDEYLSPDSPEDDALIIDEGQVEGPLSPLNSRDRGVAASCSKPLRVLIEREDPPQFMLDVVGDELEVVGAVDATPTSSRRAAECVFPSAMRSTPVYDVSEKEVVGIVRKEAAKEEEAPRGRSRVCWNCEGDHVITECSLPRNPAAIQRNRRIFLENKTQRAAAAAPQRRYHEEKEVRKEEVEPGGVLSPELRHAMGLSGNQLPGYIYRMRIYGYPPGWLEKAKAASLPLKVYDPRNHQFFPEDPSTGLILRSQIVQYPGYNAPLPPGFVDECRTLNFPPMHEVDSIDTYLTKVNAPDLRRRRRSKETFDPSADFVPRSVGSALKSPPREDWTGVTSIESLDTPVLNTGERLGCGRGRFRPPVGEEVKVRGRGALLSHLRPLCTSTPKKKEETIVAPVVPDAPVIDERYLPRAPKALVRKSARAKSPSLLRTGGDEEDVEGMEERPLSPIIVNLPPTMAETARGRGRSVSSSSSTTGGSATGVMAKPAPATVVVDLEKEDGECDTTIDSNVTLVKNLAEEIVIDLEAEEEAEEEAGEGSLVIDVERWESVSHSVTSGGSPRKVPQPAPKRRGASLEMDDCIDVESDEYIPPAKKVRKVVEEVVVELGSSGEESGSSSNKRRREEGGGRVGGASDSETGDEEAESGANGEVRLSYKKRKLGGDEEDWEAEESTTEPQHTVYGSTVPGNPALNAEFVPANSQLEAVKAMILSSALEDEDDEIAVIGEVKGGEASSTYSAGKLPSFDKFAAGMPRMVFEEDAEGRTGRFDRVLDILRQKKGNRGK